MFSFAVFINLHSIKEKKVRISSGKKGRLSALVAGEGLAVGDQFSFTKPSNIFCVCSVVCFGMERSLVDLMSTCRQHTFLVNES